MKISFLFLALLSGVSVFAQKRAQSLYLEFGGPSNASLNYDMRFSPKATAWGGRTGLGGFWTNTDAQKMTGLSIPLEINYFFSYKVFSLELGAGLVYNKISYNNKNSPVDSSASALDPYLDAALRYTAPHGRFICRAAYTPVLDGKNNSGPASLMAGAPFGISLGLRLGRR